MIDRAIVPVRQRKHARPRELLVAAMALFIEKGFAATRTEEIAERAGVSKGTLYLYFNSKEHLFTDLIAERFFCRLPFEGDERLDARAWTELLHGVVAAWASALNDGRAGGVVKLMFTEVHHFPVLADFWVHQVMEPTRAVVRQAVERGIASAEFGVIDPDLVMNALVQQLIATCLHRQVINSYVSCPSSPATTNHLRATSNGSSGADGRPHISTTPGILTARTLGPASNHRASTQSEYPCPRSGSSQAHPAASAAASWRPHSSAATRS